MAGKERSTSERPTLKTIAFITGLGVTTVSRALSDAPDIAQSTKERVRLVARQVGYRPNRAGVRLRTGKTNVIALVLSLETEVLGIAPHIVAGISGHLAGTRYHLVVTPYRLGTDPLDPVRYIVETGSADGIIFSRTEPRDPRVTYLHERGFPFATHGRTEMGLEHPYFDYDNERYAETAVDRLVRRGRSRLALLAPPTRYTYARHMNAGFQRGVERHDVTDVPLRTIDTDSTEAEIHAEISRVMAGPRFPDGIVCGSAQAAITAVVAAESAGRVIGEDFDVAVKESFGLMKKFRAPIEVVHENFRSAGAALAHAVLATIDGAPPEGLQTLETPKE